MEGRKEGRKEVGRKARRDEGRKARGDEGGWKVHSNESIKMKLVCVSVGATKGLQ